MFKRKVHDDIRWIIRKWMYDFDDNGFLYKNHVIVNFEVYGRNIYIYSNRPGLLIGKAGKYVDDLKNRLKEGGIHKNIKFVELGYFGQVSEIRIKRRWF